MTASRDDDWPETLLTQCIRQPASGLRHLPAIVGLVEAEDARTRLAAAWVCCLVCTEFPDSVPYVVRRMAAHLDDEATLELTHALDYLADRDPEAVADAIDELAAEAGEMDGRSVTLPQTGNFTRNYYYDSTPDRSGVGRVRMPGSADTEDPRRAYSEAEPDESRAIETEAEDADGTEGDEESSADPGSLVRRTTDVSAIAVRSRFDQLHILASRRRSRYSEDFDALVGRGGDEEAIALRLLHLPEEDGARPAFEEAVREHLDAWAGVDDHPHVVSLLDWGNAPRPWIVTSFAGESLATLGHRSREQAQHDGIAVADAVARCHRADIVHGGLDPGNVAYPGDVLDANDQKPPLLNNVGLVSLFRPHTNPARLLDPRYAAPEYFDRRFGTVDAATDVYGVGALLYRLYAGEPPVTGTFEAVESAVTGPETPVPGMVDPSVPGAIDDVVAKATATQKLRRYDTVEHLRQDLVGLREDGLA